MFSSIKGLSTREAGRGHATPHMPVETAKCWWLLKIEPNAWAGGKGSCAVCVDLQAVGALEFFGELYSLAKGFGPIFEGVWAGFRESEGSIFSNHQHFAVSTGICGVACPLPASRVDKPLVLYMHIFIPGCGVSWIETVFFFLGGRGGVLPVELYGGGRKGGGRFFFTLNDLIAVSIFETSLQLHHTIPTTHPYLIPHINITFHTSISDSTCHCNSTSLHT